MFQIATQSLLARGPLRRGAQFEEISQIGIKPALWARISQFF